MVNIYFVTLHVVFSVYQAGTLIGYWTVQMEGEYVIIVMFFIKSPS